MRKRDRVLVIGAGLAGLAAAEALVDAGLFVTVVDSFPVPGGRVASFKTQTAVAGLSPGDVVEHGLHAFFQHYHALCGLMERAGLQKPPFAGQGVYFWNPQHGHYQVEGGPLFWLIHSLELAQSLRGPKAAALAALARLTTALPALLKDANGTDQRSAQSMLRHFGVPEPAIEHVFRPCLYSLTSLPLERLSALEMLRWLLGILPDPRMRSLQGGGSQALCIPIANALKMRGVDLRFGVEVTRIAIDKAGRPHVHMIQAPDRTGLRHVLVKGFVPDMPPNPDAFDAVISTLPWERLVLLCDESLTQQMPEIWSNLTLLQNIHPLTIRLWFSRPIMGAKERYILSSETVFDVLRPTPTPESRDGISLIDALVENIDADLADIAYQHERYLAPGAEHNAVVERVRLDLERLFPGQILDNPLRASFVHTREGILACTPGTWSKRPSAYVGLPNFFLAGDYTQQPFGTCMEGATRSGQLAAQALLKGGPVTAERKPFSQVAFSAYSLFQRR